MARQTKGDRRNPWTKGTRVLVTLTDDRRVQLATSLNRDDLARVPRRARIGVDGARNAKVAEFYLHDIGRPCKCARCRLK